MKKNWVMFVVFVVCAMNTAVFARTVKKSPKTTFKVIDGKVVKYTEIVAGKFSASHRNLCGPNDQMGMDTFVYSTECCEKVDGECVSEKSCRTPKATCLDKDGQGNIVGTYESFGLKDCGACAAVSLDDPAEVLGNGFY